jgi:hypothetical protein
LQIGSWWGFNPSDDEDCECDCEAEDFRDSFELWAVVVGILSGISVFAVVVAVVVLLVAVTVVGSDVCRGERRCDENHRFNLSFWVEGPCFREPDRDGVCVENE